MTHCFERPNADGPLGMPGGPMIKTKKSGWQTPKDRNKKKRR